MKIVENSISKIDLLLNAFKTITKTNLSDYSNLDSVVDDYTIMTEDGSYVSIFEIKGVKKIMDESERLNLEEKFNISLSSMFSSDGVEVQFCYVRNPENTKDFLMEKTIPYINTAKNYDVSDFSYFENKVNFLSDYIVEEKVYMVIWSKPSLIYDLIKTDKEENSERLKELNISGKITNAQNPIRLYKNLYYEHQANVKNLKSSLGDECGIDLDLLDVNKACNIVRRSVYGKDTSNKWEPVSPYNELLGGQTDDDKIYHSEKDISEYLWPPISEQVFSQDIERESSSIIQMGDYYYSSFSLKVASKSKRYFNDLISRVDKRTPFMISFTLTGDGLQKVAFKKIWSSILAMANAENKHIRNSLTYLNLAQDVKNETIVKFNVNFATWSSSIDKLKINRSTLNREIQSWGKQTTQIVEDDPIEGYLSCVPGLSDIKSGKTIIAPLKKVIHFLPIFRPAHAWEQGSIMFRTNDYKLLPYEPMNANQKYWNDIIFAEPGSGKSVLLQMLVLAKILSPSLDSSVAKELPYIGILDIGFSSRGVVKFLKDFLGKDYTHQVIHKRLTNSIDDAINIFDTQLGARKPTPLQKTFLINTLSSMTINDDGSNVRGMSKMLDALIDEVYLYYSDENSPKRYESSKSVLINKVLKKLNIDPTNMTWWNVVDALFDKKQYRYAAIAQRYAVPVLKDLIKVSKETPNIKDNYSDMVDVGGTGQSLLKALTRAITEANKAYPNLSVETRLSVEDSRIIVLDLGEVTESNPVTIVQKQKNAIMYMVGREVVAKNFYINEDLLKTIPNRYKAYHAARIKKSKKLKKSIFYDEFHKTEGIEAVLAQVFRDMREGRKHNVGITLASQVLKDFSENMQLMSTAVFILDNNNSDNVEKQFKLTKSEKHALDNLKNSKDAGVALMGIFRLKEGRYVQTLYNTLSPTELWSYNSSSDDNRLIEEMELEFGTEVTRKLLSRKFPNGELKPFLEELSHKTDDPEILNDRLGFVKNLLRQEYKLMYSDN